MRRRTDFSSSLAHTASFLKIENELNETSAHNTGNTGNVPSGGTISRTGGNIPSVLSSTNLRALYSKSDSTMQLTKGKKHNGNNDNEKQEESNPTAISTTNAPVTQEETADIILAPLSKAAERRRRFQEVDQEALYLLRQTVDIATDSNPNKELEPPEASVIASPDFGTKTSSSSDGSAAVSNEEPNHILISSEGAHETEKVEAKGDDAEEEMKTEGDERVPRKKDEAEKDWKEAKEKEGTLPRRTQRVKKTTTKKGKTQDRKQGKRTRRAGEKEAKLKGKRKKEAEENGRREEAEGSDAQEEKEVFSEEQEISKARSEGGDGNTGDVWKAISGEGWKWEIAMFSFFDALEMFHQVPSLHIIIC